MERRLLYLSPITFLDFIHCFSLRDSENAFHSTKISGNSDSKSNGTEKVSENSFHKFRATSRAFGNSGNFPFHLPFLPGINRLLVENLPRRKLQESTIYWMQNDLPKFKPVLDCLSSTKMLGSDFLENCVLVVANFLWA